MYLVVGLRMETAAQSLYGAAALARPGAAGHPFNEDPMIAPDQPPQADPIPPTALPPRRAGTRAARRMAAPQMPRWRSFGWSVLVLGALWVLLTDLRTDALAFGVPAVLAGASLVFVLPPARRWRLSPGGLVIFVAWFAVQSVRGAWDVALRALSPQMRLRPGFRRYTPNLPPGTARIVFLNTITLLPGTLAVEVEDDSVIVHMLDTRADLKAELGVLEARVAALFALD